jgi:hypothetical protein
MSNFQQVINLIKRMARPARILAIPQPLVAFVGSVDAGLLLAQIIFWSDKTRDKAGWFYKTYDEWQAEIYLSEYEVRKNARKLVEMGLIETKVKKAPNGNPTVHYRLDWVNFLETFRKFLEAGKDSHCRIDPEESAETLNTELTTEMTGINRERGDERKEKFKVSREPSPAPSPLLKQMKKVVRIQREELDEGQELEIRDWRLEIKGRGSVGVAESAKARLRAETGQEGGKHPAIEIYRQVTGRYPPPAAEPLITEAGIETAQEQQLWEKVIRSFICCGWRAQNIVGMLDFYHRQEIPGTRPRRDARSGSRWGGYNGGTQASLGRQQGYQFATLEDFGLPPEAIGS